MASVSEAGRQASATFGHRSGHGPHVFEKLLRGRAVDLNSCKLLVQPNGIHGAAAHLPVGRPRVEIHLGQQGLYLADFIAAHG